VAAVPSRAEPAVLRFAELGRLHRRPPGTTIAQQDEFDPLPSLSPLPMTLSDFTRRIQQDRGQAIKERKVQMTGFVTLGEQGEGWYLTRLMINCCAADVQSVKVRIHKAENLPADTWVTVVGTGTRAERSGRAPPRSRSTPAR
jgi:uncharacterized repeat protein (TIGR03943 family)